MFSLRLRSENERKGNKINAGKSIGSDANFPSIRLGLVKFVIAKPAIFRCYQNSCNFLLNSCKLVFISVHGKSIPGRRHKHTHDDFGGTGCTFHTSQTPHKFIGR